MRQPARDEDVLVRDRHAAQRPRVAGGERASAALAPARSVAFGIDGDEGVRARGCALAMRCEQMLRRARRSRRRSRRRAARPTVSAQRAQSRAACAFTRSPSAPGTGRPRPPARLRWLRFALVVLGDHVVAQRAAPRPDATGATSARRRVVSTALHLARSCRRIALSLLEHRAARVGVEFDAGEMRDARDVGEREGHGGKAAKRIANGDMSWAQRTAYSQRGSRADPRFACKQRANQRGICRYHSGISSPRHIDSTTRRPAGPPTAREGLSYMFGFLPSATSRPTWPSTSAPPTR